MSEATFPNLGRYIQQVLGKRNELLKELLKLGPIMFKGIWIGKVQRNTDPTHASETSLDRHIGWHGKF